MVVAVEVHVDLLLLPLLLLLLLLLHSLTALASCMDIIAYDTAIVIIAAAAAITTMAISRVEAIGIFYHL